ncbi:MAG: PmoA family protein [Bacteroidota bacterium]|nr:PmoA family protein [Bacteroidota bacterium]MDP4211392.1 PmoA family protein [Bacteroidota bacterium]MDP4248619.1 PmoA family protein [Bacteroidota bacterium]
MKWNLRIIQLALLLILFVPVVKSQHQDKVKLVKADNKNRIDIFVGNKLFTQFLYPDTLEKPVLYPIFTADGTQITRSFPMHNRPGDPTDHPHHLGLWLNYENVNGLDFWNNSYAIPAEKKHSYGWIKTDRIEKMSDGTPGLLVYHANWCNQRGDVLLEETTRFEFSGKAGRRMIDRITELKADKDVFFADAKDGMLGLRLAHELQIPSREDQKFSDDKGNVTLVKAGMDKIANGNYMTSEGRQGDAAWGTRGVWCKVYGKMGSDSVSVAIIDHPQNPDYPTFWHARGYGLFAANPLGKKVFTQGKDSLNLRLKKGDSVRFRYRIVVDENNKTIPADELNRLASDFARSPER